MFKNNFLIHTVDNEVETFNTLEEAQDFLVREYSNEKEGYHQYKQMKTLKLTLNKQWFDLIEKGIKTEEYREIKDYWITRLCFAIFDENGNQRQLIKPDNIDYHRLLFKDFDFVEFTNGYSKTSPQIIMECKVIEVGTGKFEWGAVENTQYFVIKLGREVGRQNCG
jgi:hypothetical protein